MYNSKTYVAPNLFFQCLMFLSIPLIFFGHFGTLAAAIWLVYNGCWSIFFHGWLIAFLGAIFIPILLMPSSWILWFAQKHDENKMLFRLSVFLSSIYSTILSTVICLLIVKFFLSSASEGSFIPALKWAYGTATFPFILFARQVQQECDVLIT